MREMHCVILFPKPFLVDVVLVFSTVCANLRVCYAKRTHRAERAGHYSWAQQCSSSAQHADACGFAAIAFASTAPKQTNFHSNCWWQILHSTLEFRETSLHRLGTSGSSSCDLKDMKLDINLSTRCNPLTDHRFQSQCIGFELPLRDGLWKLHRPSVRPSFRLPSVAYKGEGLHNSSH